MFVPWATQILNSFLQLALPCSCLGRRPSVETHPLLAFQSLEVRLVTPYKAFVSSTSFLPPLPSFLDVSMSFLGLTFYEETSGLIPFLVFPVQSLAWCIVGEILFKTPVSHPRWSQGSR